MVIKKREKKVTNSETVNETETKYIFVRKGGKSIIERRPVFSPDGQFLAVVVENTVRAYNVETGECVRTLETEGHTDELIAIEFPSEDPHNLYGCSVKGVITIWTWENGAVLRERKLKTPTDLDIKCFSLINSRVCLLVLGKATESFMQMMSYSVTTGDLEIVYRHSKPLYHELVSMGLGTSNGDQFAALTNGTKLLFIQNLTKPHIREQILHYSGIRLLSVSVHGGVVATTDALGRITIFRGNVYDSKEFQGRETLHWHFLPTFCSTFSTEGKYIYSGGMEKVLVKWTLGEKEKLMMPRLPGHIRFITTDNAHVAVTLSNNSIVIADPQLRATCTILECGGLSPVMRAVGGTLLYHQRLAGLIVPGRTGHLQLFSTATNKVLYNVDITQKNEVPAERYNLIPLDTEVTCVAISGDGYWLATSEYRNDSINYPEEKLKFWQVVAKQATPFLLRTSVNLPHGGFNVVSLAFDKQGDYCVSAGLDQKFRIWKRETEKNTPYFVCITACYYSSGNGNTLSHDIMNNIKHHNVKTYGKEKYPYLRVTSDDDILVKIRNIHREHELVDSGVLTSGMKTDDSDMSGVDMSQDGSLIAAWFGCKLTLWDSHLCSIRTTLSHPALRPKGLQVKFGSHDTSHYLVCTTENCLAVWSLLSLTIKWMVQIRPSCLAADRFSNRMAVVTQENDLFVFTPSSPTPILTKKRLLNPETGLFKQLTFGVPGDHIRLFLMRNNSEIYTIEPATAAGARLEALPWSQEPRSAFSALLAAQRASAVRAPASGAVAAWDAAQAAGAAHQVLSAAPHMMPPVSLLSTAFLEQIALTKFREQPENNAEESVQSVKEEDKMEVDQESSDDEEQNTLNGPTPKMMELWTPNYEAVKQKRLVKIMKEPFLDLASTNVLVGL